MGREIRNVPPNWQHPTCKDIYGNERLQPMYDQTYAEARAEWLDSLKKWEDGRRQEYVADGGEDIDYWEYEGPPPERQYYRPWTDEEATWFQVWETVSEGTPVSPAFATEEELADYLAKHGDFWDQKRCQEPDWKSLWGGTPGVSGWGERRAKAFVSGSGWSVSMMMVDGNIISNPGEIAEAMKETGT